MLLPQRIAEFRQLFREFAQAYLSQPRGQAHLQNYEAGRIQGRQNFEEIREESPSGAPTDMVLQRLLPHTDTAAHRNAGSWIHIAHAIQGDVKTWFEAAGWRRPDNWPNTARAIYDFLLRCMESPSELELACHAFANSPFTTGLQTGMLTPSRSPSSRLSRPAVAVQRPLGRSCSAASHGMRRVDAFRCPAAPPVTR
jgi:5-methylcytosine-specific restriction enzyme B